MRFKAGRCLCLSHFNLAGEKAASKSGIQLRPTLFNSTVQLLGYVDNFYLVARSEGTIRELFLDLKDATRNLGLVVNEAKMKYIRIGGPKPGAIYLDATEHCLQRINSFTYLGLPKMEGDDQEDCCG